MNPEQTFLHGMVCTAPLEDLPPLWGNVATVVLPLPIMRRFRDRLGGEFP